MDEMDILYSQCVTTPLELGEATDCQPLPCWCRGRRRIPLEELPLLQLLKKLSIEDPGAMSRHRASGVGRGRPADSISHPMPNGPSDCDYDVVGQYWRRQRPLHAPTLNAASEFPSSEEPSGRLEEPADPEPAISPMPRRGIADAWKKRIAQVIQPPAKRDIPAASSSSSRTKRELLAHSPNPSNPPHRPPAPPLPPPPPPPQRQRGLFIRAPAARGSNSSQTAQAQMQAALATNIKRGSFNASSFNHAHDLTSWVASLSQPRPHDSDDDDLTDDGDDRVHRHVPALEDLVDELASTSSSNCSAEQLTDEEIGCSPDRSVAVTITEVTEDDTHSCDSVCVGIGAGEMHGQGNHLEDPD